MLNKIKYTLIGPPLPNQQIIEKKLNKIRALAAFSPDALSSIAYANQEIYLGLALAGSLGLTYQLPIAIGIVLLLGVVTLSYAEVIQGYPRGGGSYVVARENLGTLPGLVAGAALLLDYVLTAAVSLTAGVAAIASAFPELWSYRVWVALALLLVITLLNLRGQRETGTVMAVPVYLFLVSFILMLVYGFIKTAIHGVPPAAVTPPLQAAEPLTLLLILHAFSAGCTALTGIEAISDGVMAFKPVEWVNARKTLFVMGVIMALMFIGSISLTQMLGITAQDETILSALARTILGRNFAYYLVQLFTLGVLAVAANTSFSGFPRVAVFLAEDRFLPRQLLNVGDRLVFNNGIYLLSALTALLIILFNGDSHALVPLFAVGAFTAFTISQAGMVAHWVRQKTGGWHIKAFANGLGALVTGAALLIIGASKFIHGAWISILVIPLLVTLFLSIRRHYTQVGKQLTLHGLPPSLRPFPRPRLVIPVSGVHRGMIDAVNFGRSITDRITAVFVDTEPDMSNEKLKNKWNEWFPDIPLVILESPYRSIVQPLLNYLEEIDHKLNDGQHAILVLPEIIPASSLHEALHNQAADQIKKALLYQRRHAGLQRIIIDVPYHLHK